MKTTLEVLNAIGNADDPFQMACDLKADAEGKNIKITQTTFEDTDETIGDHGFMKRTASMIGPNVDHYYGKITKLDLSRVNDEFESSVQVLWGSTWSSLPGLGTQPSGPVTYMYQKHNNQEENATMRTERSCIKDFADGVRKGYAKIEVSVDGCGLSRMRKL